MRSLILIQISFHISKPVDLDLAFVQSDSDQFLAFNSGIGIGYLNNYPVSLSPCQGFRRLHKVPSNTIDFGIWGQEVEQDLSNHYSFFGKMETEGILNSLNGETSEFKEDSLNENSRSCSPSIDDQSNDHSEKAGKIDSKVCGVCGDKALGNNFNAITCESCKAFFRRNALKPKDFVCPFNGNCKVDPVTRRFCQKCRLKKCFDIGMKKEWIMTDEEKKLKKHKIEQNRLKRQSSDAPPLGGDVPLPKTSCLVPEDHESNSPNQDTLTLIADEPHHRGNEFESNVLHAEAQPHLSFHQTGSLSHQSGEMAKQGIIQRVSLNDQPRDSYDNSSNSSDASVPTLHYVNSNVLHMEYGLKTGNNKLKSPESNLCSVNNGIDHTNRIRSKGEGNGRSISWQSDQDVQILTDHENECKISSGKFSSQHIYEKSRIYGTQQHISNIHPHLNGNNELSQTPLLTSLIRPGTAESPPDADLVDCSASNIVTHSSSNNVQESPSRKYSVLHDNMKNDNEVGLERSPENKHSHSYNHFRDRNPEFLQNKSHGLNSNSNSVDRDTVVPLPLNTMDSILSVAITAEYNSFGMLGRNSGPQSRELNIAERAKLNELRSASQALHAPVDADPMYCGVKPFSNLNSACSDAESSFKLEASSDPSLINVINLTDIAIRRLIQMSKKISGFKNMCQEDQIALLKGSCTEMMILRSAVSYDPDRDSWNIPHSFGYNIKLGVLKEARGNLYEEHQRFVRSFKPIWRTDENIMIILCVITLFTAERPNVVHKDVVKLEQDSYYYLLKRYLESTLNGCEARSTYLQLIRKIAELHELNSNHLRVFLEVNPREVEPLLIEIFDLKQ